MTLVSDGTIRFHYGAGNTGLSPTVGISQGDGQFYVLGPHDGQSTLTNANSLQYTLTPGMFYVDMGAYEFRGDSNDIVPPQLIATTPAFIDENGTSGVSLSEIQVLFSEELNLIDANATANYELRRSVNGILDDGDDLILDLTPTYVFDVSTGTNMTTLDLGTAVIFLPPDTYRLTVHGNVASSLHDTAGNRLDGNRDGVVVGSSPDEYVRTFVILARALPFRPPVAW